MAIDSNRPYSRVNVQAQNNDTIWNGAAWGAGAGIGAMGLTYGATTFGARGIENLNRKVAGNKATRMAQRHRKLEEVGKPSLSQSTIDDLGRYQVEKGIRFLGQADSANKFMFGSKKRMIASAATGLMGGMLAGGAIDHLN